MNGMYHKTGKKGSLITFLLFNKLFKYLLLSVLTLSISSCSTIKGDSTISILAGYSAGGLVENTEMSGIDGVSDIDSISGASKILYNAGIHTEINIKGHSIETGLDYICFDQSVGYKLPSLLVTGNRDFNFHQLRFPITYNFHLLKKAQNYSKLILKGGMSIGYTFSKLVTENGNVPDYTFTNWDYGPTLGVAVYPFLFKQNYRVGFYLDFYRGSQIYDDIYHESEGMGGHSFMKLGVSVQPLSLKY